MLANILLKSFGFYDSRAINAWCVPQPGERRQMPKLPVIYFRVDLTEEC